MLLDTDTLLRRQSDDTAAAPRGGASAAAGSACGRRAGGGTGFAGLSAALEQAGQVEHFDGFVRLKHPPFPGGH